MKTIPLKNDKTSEKTRLGWHDCWKCMTRLVQQFMINLVTFCFNLFFHQPTIWTPLREECREISGLLWHIFLEEAIKWIFYDFPDFFNFRPVSLSCKKAIPAEAIIQWRQGLHTWGSMYTVCLSGPSLNYLLSHHLSRYISLMTRIMKYTISLVRKHHTDKLKSYHEYTLPSTC